MPLSPIEVKCTNCLHTFTSVPKRTFLAFQKFNCPTCTAEVIYPLSTKYCIGYTLFSIVILAQFLQLIKGASGTLGGVCIAMIYALIRSWAIKKQIQKISQNPPMDGRNGYPPIPSTLKRNFGKLALFITWLALSYVLGTFGIIYAKYPLLSSLGTQSAVSGISPTTGGGISAEKHQETKTATNPNPSSNDNELAEQPPLKEPGSTRDQRIRGLKHYFGIAQSKDYNQAFYWLTKAAKQGDAMAQYWLGVMYYNGDGVPQDYKKTVYWYTKSAEQGNADAQFNLGLMYYNGDGVPQDYKKTVYWYTKSAEQGNADAQFNLGLMYYNGDGVPQDYKKTVYWYTKSAEQGNADAQNNLGALYYAGEGVPQNYSAAYVWLSLSAANGNKKAIKNRNLAELELTSAALGKAQQEATALMQKIEQNKEKYLLR